MAAKLAPSLVERLTPLKLMAFDVDGVLTDGRLFYLDSGVEVKSFDTQDGQGLRLLREAGLKIALITARKSDLVERRARDLGVHFCYQGMEAKRQGFEEILGELKLRPDQAGYMGDDLLDLPVLRMAGFAATVPSAPDIVRSNVHYVATKAGGRGSVREVCELILEAQGCLEQVTAPYLQ